MALVPKFKQSDIQSMMKKAEQMMIDKVVRVLRYVGEQAVNEAKNSGSYKDQTGNLRSSVGYVITINGVVQDTVFNGDKADGVKKGKDLALSIARQQPDIALVVVAGMNYGLYVESRGYNVLTSAEQLAKVQVPNLLKQLKL